MRNTLTLHRLVSVLAICLLVVGLGWAAGGKQKKGKVEIVASKSFTVDFANVTEINNHPHLKFSVKNTSDELVPAMTVTLTALDAQGKVRARQTWLTHADLPVGSKTNSILAITANVKSADRITVEFTANTAEENACTDSFCQTCTQSASTLCGAGKVLNYHCTVGAECNCSFDCKGLIE